MLSGLFKNATINNADTTSAAKFNLWRCGNINAFELIFPLNLPNATTEPVKVTAPIKIPKRLRHYEYSLIPLVQLQMRLVLLHLILLALTPRGVNHSY